MENISDLLNYLQAPRHNTVWSWGSVRQSDGAVFLLVWTDETIMIDNKMYTRILDSSGQGHGYNERKSHIEKIKSGSPAYLIYCTARDPKVTPRTIKSFNKKTVFQGGDIRVADDRITWIENKDRIDIMNARGS
jgi:hypothetical protein